MASKRGRATRVPPWTCTTRRPSPSCGRRSAPGSMTRRSSPPINAPFDRSVLHACCARYRLRLPRTPFTCTVQLARAQWGIRPTKLPDVCRRLQIPLRHHDAGADALACARIVLAAQADGWLPGKRRTHRTATRAMVRVSTPVGRTRSTSLLRWPAFVRLLQTWWQRLDTMRARIVKAEEARAERMCPERRCACFPLRAAQIVLNHSATTSTSSTM